MASDQNHDNLEWALHALGPDSPSPHSLSFHLSQSTSFCHVETENSMKVDLSKDDIPFFSCFLTALSCHSSLRSLEFHLVDWELEQMQELRRLLEDNSGVRQVVFRRNRLSNECLVELCCVLRTNRGIKELMFSECGIGSVGVGLIASGLKTNDSLEELQVWEDSIGSKGMEELSKMVEENTTLKLLSIFDSNSVTVTPLISGNSTLRIYRLDINGACRVANALGLNSTVKTLDMTGIRLKSRWAKEFRWALEQNQCLREVKLSKSHLKDEAIVHIGAGLFKNKHLQSLFLDGNLFTGIGVEHLLCPLSRFSTLITININGIYVRVELGGQLGYYIDVLACSTKSLTETLRFIQQLIIPAIHDLCHGIILTESIIRPECVQNLVPPRHRKTQHVSIQQLKLALLSVPADGMYEYQHTWCPVSDGGREIVAVGFDFARDLLSDDDFREVLHRRYHDLYNLAVELQVPHENNPEAVDHSLSNDETDKVEATFGGIAKGVEAVLQRLKIIEQEIRDLKQEIKGLRYYEHRLLLELNRKVNYLVNYNVEIEERRVPNMFYFVRTENYSRRLITNLISGMNALRLHMLCEFRREMHVVEDQIGCEVMRIDNMAVRSLAPYMTKFMKLVTFSLRIGAQIAMGMGHLIPDLSREVAHLADSSLFHGAAGAAAAGAVGAAAIGRVGLNRGRSRAGDIQQDLRTAQQWVVDYLREQRCSTGKDIAEKFGLWRVRYRDDGHIAWICRRHMNLRAHEITEVPI